jgi:SNF2 family DNA or RNA helicase
MKQQHHCFRRRAPSAGRGHKLALGATVRGQFLDALNWRRFHYHTHVNSILADETGLGKTVMYIAMLDYIINRCDVPGRFLIMAPLGTLPNWKREFESCTEIEPIILHGLEGMSRRHQTLRTVFRPTIRDCSKIDEIDLQRKKDDEQRISAFREIVIDVIGRL